MGDSVILAKQGNEAFKMAMQVDGLDDQNQSIQILDVDDDRKQQIIPNIDSKST